MFGCFDVFFLKMRRCLDISFVLMGRSVDVFFFRAVIKLYRQTMFDNRNLVLDVKQFLKKKKKVTSEQRLFTNLPWDASTTGVQRTLELLFALT